MVGTRQKIPILRYVLVALAIKALVAVGFMSVPYLLPQVDVDNLSDISTPVTIAASVIAISWYTREFNVALPLGAILRFALGVMLGDLFLSASFVAFALIEAGQPFTVAGLNIALLGGDQSDDLVITILAVGAIVGGVITFALSGLVAWLMTRKLSGIEEVFD